MLLWLWKCLGDVVSVVDMAGATVIVEDVVDGVAVVVHAVTVSTTGVVAGVYMLEVSVRVSRSTESTTHSIVWIYAYRAVNNSRASCCS
ncbi:unnamed protein product [Gongylonema pulchrum]|uniref:Secreted protein n=1 Tax=Gongylonema pulchrum TaxID=637853 RepID=A0A183CVA5_9BILA|nr:unnamed protein product [Gongylonema pulchrum]